MGIERSLAGYGERKNLTPIYGSAGAAELLGVVDRSLDRIEFFLPP
ncbi:hypothetical protein Y023_5666 [Burkholderia pseudomallei A79D]|nr:hypothetical protein Y023_5666 [Burkholderia pseudomallei A79D]KGX95411.1 hypothetical protein X997_5505 [Burkholderia pseudomallei A79C]